MAGPLGQLWAVGGVLSGAVGGHITQRTLQVVWQETDWRVSWVSAAWPGGNFRLDLASFPTPAAATEPCRTAAGHSGILVALRGLCHEQPGSQELGIKPGQAPELGRTRDWDKPQMGQFPTCTLRPENCGEGKERTRAWALGFLPTPSSAALLCVCVHVRFLLNTRSSGQNSWKNLIESSSFMFTQSCLTLCDPMDCSMPGFPVHHQLLKPEACSNSCPSSQWYHPIILSSVAPFSSCLRSFPVSGSFPVGQFFASGGQSIGASASASVLSMNIQDWFPLGLTDWISL